MFVARRGLARCLVPPTNCLRNLYPQLTFGRIPPPEPVKSLLADFKQEATPRTRCNGRLRINTRLRPYDDGS